MMRWYCRQGRACRPSWPLTNEERGGGGRFIGGREGIENCMDVKVLDGEGEEDGSKLEDGSDAGGEGGDGLDEGEADAEQAGE